MAGAEKTSLVERIRFMKSCMRSIIGEYKTDPNDAKVGLDELLTKFTSPTSRFLEGQLLEPERDMRPKIVLFCFKAELNTTDAILRMKEAKCIPASVREAASFIGQNKFYESPSRIVILEGTKEETKIFPFLSFKREDGILRCELRASLEEDVWGKDQIFMGAPE